MTKTVKKQISLIDKYLKRLVRLYTEEYEAALDEIKGLVLHVYSQIMVEDTPLLSHLYQFRRYYKLTRDIQKVLTQLGVKQERLFTEQVENYFKANAEILDDQFEVPFETKQAEMQKALNYLIEDTQWSDSIWRDKSQLLSKIRHELVMNVATGKSIDQMAEALAPETITNNFYNRKRLVRTELVKYYSKTTIERYKDAGVKEVVYHAVMDKRTCEECKEKDGKKMSINSKDLPPTHPNCRCYISPVV